jgi:aminomethyltransferase
VRPAGPPTANAEPEVALRTSPLDARHRARRGKMVPFGGWDMPIQYPTGTLAEHRACRTGAAAFDVSHLGTVRVTGPGAYDRLQAALTNDLGKIAPGRAQYTHLLDEADASVLDDIIVWWVTDDRLDVMPNASNTERVLGALGGDDVTATRAIIAVQGPAARERLATVAPEAAAVGRFRVAEVDVLGRPSVVAGTGYTGEDGVELAIDADHAGVVWDAVVAAGIGARDTLRLEAGLPLHGHELGPGITPLQAGLGWVVSWDKGEFRGRKALADERERGVERKLRGLQVEGRRPPRADQSVMSGGVAIGRVTSGNYSPTLDRGIALAFLPPRVGDERDVAIDVRGSEVPAKVVALPFYKRASG